MGHLRPAEQRMARFFVDQKSTVLLNSAAEIAEKAGTSDATVVRTARSLGFDGLAGLREAILSDITGPAPADRLARTLQDVSAASESALTHVLKEHYASVNSMASPEFGAAFERTVDTLFTARRRHVFGIGPSGCIAEYAAMQFNRIGLRSSSLSSSGIGLADKLQEMEAGDAVLMLAYAPIYREVSVALDRADELGVPTILISDSLGTLDGRIAELLPVARGRADHLAMHGATLVLVEAMIVALASRDKSSAVDSLRTFGALRGALDKSWLKRRVR
ncbi:transcriptional regulator [Azorhizobium oxalatiphilum]|uniref:Transcriptional regulator n=2 Tax=Azorhizobium oxalatiphilum TaxID=980631 RepID=A0A917BLJ3_9HYPH|nr:transcriptional regulator [Azorhizobium oxalatiphilum]